MTWFKVDDGLHKNRKRVRVGITADGFAAMGLWTVAGSWSSDELTEGFIPDDILDYLAPGVGKDLAERLEQAGFWFRSSYAGEEGWQFHDWDNYQPSRAEVLAANAKKSSGGALGNHRRWHAEKGKTDPRCTYCTNLITDRSSDRSTDRSSDRLSDRISESGASRPSRPDPYPLSSKSVSAGFDLSLTKQDHPNGSNQNLSEEDHEARLRLRWQGTGCPEHRGPTILNCIPCGSDHKDRGYWTHHDWATEGSK